MYRNHTNLDRNFKSNKYSKSKEEDLPVDKRFICVLTMKKNNFFVSILDDITGKTIFYRTCGMLKDIDGSKKFTVVALEELGKDIFIRTMFYGKVRYRFELELRFFFKINKFVKSFIRGLYIYGKPYVDLEFDIVYHVAHNGLRSKKKRRV